MLIVFFGSVIYVLIVFSLRGWLGIPDLAWVCFSFSAAGYLVLKAAERQKTKNEEKDKKIELELERKIKN